MVNRRDFLIAGAGAIVAARAADPPSDLAALTLKQASDRIRAKKVSPVELTEACLARMKAYNPKTNAWITIMREQALAQAKVLEKEQAAGKSVRGALTAGYSRAFSTIFDSHITTLISSILLIMLGTGAIKGFGVALTIGVALSLFTALVVTRRREISAT